MSRKISGVFAKKMEKKIADQEQEVDRAFQGIKKLRRRPTDESARARSFYWEGTSSMCCGSAAFQADPSFYFPVLPQLLVTPRLIVDIFPLRKDEFARRYGVTPRQMLLLADERFVIPNIYYYYSDAWRDYAKCRALWPVLEHPEARINPLWISAYLDRFHRFSHIKDKATKFFQGEIDKIGSNEAKKVISALQGATQSIERVPGICGHILAYLQTLSKNRADDVISDIKERWQTKGRRDEAVKLLRATQVLTIGALTAAFGGRSHLAQAVYDRAISVYGYPQVIASTDSPNDVLRRLNARRDLLHEAEFCLHLANEIDQLRLFPDSRVYKSTELLDVFPLSDSKFTQFLNTLKDPRVRNGEWGLWADEMTSYIRGTRSRPDLDAYRDLWREIESNLTSLPFVPAFLQYVSRMFFLVSDIQRVTIPTPQSFCLQVVFDQLGRSATCLANYLKDRTSMIVWNASVPRPLCKHWLRIRPKDKRKG